MEITIGKEVVNAGREYVNKNMSVLSYDLFKPYFRVDNEYIVKKLILILFPFNVREWDQGGRVTTPDLYIPLMSFITHILMRGITMGLRKDFRPEKLGLVATRGLFLELVFLLVSRVSAYFVDVKFNLCDMISFSGYKYFIIVLMHVFCRYRIVILIKLYLNIAFFFFLSRSFKNIVFDDNNRVNRNRKVYYLFTTVFMQICIVLAHSYLF